MKSFSFKGLADQAKAAGSKIAAATPTFEQLQAYNAAYRRSDDSASGMDASAVAQMPPQQAVAMLQEQNAQLRSALLSERQAAVGNEGNRKIAGNDPEGPEQQTLVDKKLQSQAQRLERLNATLKAKVEVLRTNLSDARGDAERASDLEKQVALLKEQLQQATGTEGRTTPELSTTVVSTASQETTSHDQLGQLQQRLDEALAAVQALTEQNEAQATAQKALQQRLDETERQAVSAAAAAADALNQQLTSETETWAAASTPSALTSGRSRHQGAVAGPLQQQAVSDSALHETFQQSPMQQRQHEVDPDAAKPSQQHSEGMPVDQQESASLQLQLTATLDELAAERKQVAALQRQVMHDEVKESAASEAVLADLRQQLETALKASTTAAQEHEADLTEKRVAGRRVNELEMELSAMRATVQEMSACSKGAAEAQQDLALVREHCRQLESQLLQKENAIRANNHVTEEQHALLESRCISAQETAAKAQEELVHAETRCTDLEQALAAKGKQTDVVSSDRLSQLANEQQNGSTSWSHGKAMAAPMPTVSLEMQNLQQHVEALQHQLAEEHARSSSSQTALQQLGSTHTVAQTAAPAASAAGKDALRSSSQETGAESTSDAGAVNGLGSAAESAVGGTESAVITQLQEDLAAAKADLATLQDELDAAKKSAAEQAHTAERQQDGLRQQLTDSQSDSVVSAEDHAAAVDDLRAQVVEARQAITTAEATALAAQQDSAAAAEARARAEANLHEAMQQAERENQAAVHARDQAESQAASTAEALAAREESMMQLAKELEEARNAARQAEDKEQLWESERQSLQERIQRLQKVNKDRRAELDEAQANLVAAKADAQQADSLRTRVAQLEPLQELLSQARAATQAAEGRLQEESASRREFLLKFQERSKAALGERQELQRQLEKAREQHSAALATAADAAAWRDMAEAAQDNVVTQSAAVARLEDQLRQAEGELDSTIATLEQERADHAHGLAAAQSQLEGLLDLDRASWPAVVRRLVDLAESAAVENAAIEARQAAEATESELEAEISRLRTAADSMSTALAEALSARDAALEQAHRVAEGAQQEAAVVAQQLQQTEVAHQAKAAALQAQLEAAEVAASQAQADSKTWAAQLDEAQLEIAAVRERAQALMAEKDLQIEQAKTRWSSRGSRSPELPVSSILRGDASPSLSKSRNVSFAEIQPVLVSTPLQDGVNTDHDDEVARLTAQVRAMQRDLVDRQHTDTLRDRAAEVLKEEVDEMRRREKRNAVDLNYVKSVLVSGFESNELSVHSSMLSVLARLLQFTPQDMRRLAATRNREWLPPWQP